MLDSSFFSEQPDEAGVIGRQLAVVLLNWTLPDLTPLLWSKGACQPGGPSAVAARRHFAACGLRSAARSAA